MSIISNDQYKGLFHKAKGGQVITRSVYIGKGITYSERLCGRCGRWVDMIAWSIHDGRCKERS